MTRISKFNGIRAKAFLAIIFVILIITGSILLLLLRDLQQDSDATLPQVEPESTSGQDDIKIIQPTQIPIIEEVAPDIRVSGWVPSWASASGLQTINQNPELFDSVSPVWYEVNSDGSLKTKFPSNKTQLLTTLNSMGIDTIATIALFDHELLSTILNSNENTKRHIDSIVKEVVNNDFAGIDLDYESIKLSDKELYLEFIKQISIELHERDKILVVTVLAKWGETVSYSYKPETRKAQDWSVISQYADQVRIMAYDFTHSSDDYPGPIGPTSWIAQILEYAKLTMPPQKTVLGIHLYAYEWYQAENSRDGLDIVVDPNGNPNTKDNTARAYTYQTVKSILQNTGELSRFQDEGIFFYSKINNSNGVSERRALVFIDDMGVESRQKLAQKYGINGIVFWRLGEEGDIYNRINTSK